MNPLLDKKILKDDIKFEEIQSKHFITAFEKLIPLVKKEFEEELYNDALDGGDVIFYNKP